MYLSISLSVLVMNSFLCVCVWEWPEFKEFWKRPGSNKQTDQHLAKIYTSSEMVPLTCMAVYIEKRHRGVKIEPICPTLAVLYSGQ